MQIHSQVKDEQKPHLRHRDVSPLASTSPQGCPGSTGRCVQARRSHTLTRLAVSPEASFLGEEGTGGADPQHIERSWCQMIHNAQIYEALHDGSGSLPFFSHIITMDDALQQDWEGLNISTARLCTVSWQEQNAVWGMKEMQGRRCLIYRLLLRCVCCVWLQTLLHQNGSVSSSSVL